MTERRMRAWAIDTGRTDVPGFIGCGWFGWEPRRSDYALMTATFATRDEARVALLKVTHKDEPGRYVAFPCARVVRVEIIVRTVKA